MAQKQRLNSELARAARLFEKGDLRRAEQAAKAVRGAAPGPASQILAGIALKQGDFESAHGHAKTAVQATPGSPQLLLNLASIEFALNRREDGLATFGEAARLAPRDFEAQLCYGKALAETGRLEEAVEQFQCAHKLAPHPRAKGPMADALFRLDRFDEAEEWAKAALGSGLDTAELHCLIGKILYAKRLPKEAAAAFQAALAKDPKNTDALMGLSCAQTRLKDIIAARDAARRYLDLRPVVRVGATKPEAHVAIVHSVNDGYFASPRYGVGLPVGGNFPVTLDSQILQFEHCFVSLSNTVWTPPKKMRTDIVLSNLVNAEMLQGDRSGLAKCALDSMGAPIINGVDGVLATSRAANADRFRDATRFRFPRTIAVERQGEAAGDTAEFILERISLPLILRPPHTQEGLGARLVDSSDELIAQIASFKDGVIYAIEYFYCAMDDGCARRYRFTHVDGELFATNMHAVRGWNAHGDSRAELNWMDSNYWREEKAFLDDADGALGFDRYEVFSEIMENTPLDLFGIDFGVARSGEVVIFEVNASMAFTVPKLAKQFPYIQPHRDYLFRKIDDYLLRRALEARETRAGA